MTFTEQSLSQRERDQLPSFLPLIFPDAALLEEDTQHYATGDSHGHVMTIISIMAYAFPDTDAAFHAATYYRLTLPYLDRQIVIEQLERLIDERKSTPDQQRYVGAMQFALTLLTASTGNDYEGLAR